jgi:hypothetical protein
MTVPRAEVAAAPPVAYLVHRTRERIRLRVPTLRYDDEGFERLSTGLERLAAVSAVRTDSRTATALLHLEPDRAVDPLMAIVESGLLRVSPARPPLSPALSALHRFSDRADEGIASLTGGLGDLRTLLFSLLVVLALRQWSRGQLMVPSLTLILYAIDLVRFERPEYHREPLP